jgi:hypothetical protein
VGAAGVVLATLAVWLIDRERRSYRGRPARVWAVWCGLCASWVVLALVLANHMREAGQGSVETARNFFGVLRVKELYPEDPTEHRYSLVHGRIEHGFQYLDGERRFWHVSYYGPDSGIGLALDRYPGRLQGGNLRIGVIGLGTGTLAVYGQPGDYIRFYEINPDVVRLSDKYFSYRRDSRARTEIVLGDARISMERERQQGEAQEFDVLAVDAFNSDAIPVHLLTRECFLTYCYHLKTNGILAFHITNRYFDLKPVIRSLLTVAPNVDTHAIWIHDTGGGNLGTDRTDWVLVTANREFLADAEVRRRMTPWTDSERPGLMWTDDYSNLFGLLNERGNND